MKSQYMGFTFYGSPSNACMVASKQAGMKLTGTIYKCNRMHSVETIYTGNPL